MRITSIKFSFTIFRIWGHRCELEYLQEKIAYLGPEATFTYIATEGTISKRRTYTNDNYSRMY